MSSVIQNMLDGVIGDGARSSKYECFIAFNRTGLFRKESDVYAFVKTSQFPGKSHEVIDFKYKGRTIPIKGQTKYDNTWTCTFYLTEDHRLKKAFEDWIESIDQVHNIAETVSSDVYAAQKANNDNGYETSMKIAQLDFHGTQETVVYELVHIFPKSVSAVEVDYSSVGTILEFTVEFSYAYFNSYTTKTNLGSFVDDIKGKAQGYLSEIVGDIKEKIASVFSNLGGASIKNLASGVNASLNNLLGSGGTSSPSARFSISTMASPFDEDFR